MNGPQLIFSGPVLQRIYNELRRAPRTAEELRDLVWGNRAISLSAIYVEIHMLRRKLHPHGLTIESCWRRRKPYRLVKLC
jgi:DNA-binding response OmpR family regulator